MALRVTRCNRKLTGVLQVPLQRSSDLLDRSIDLRAKCRHEAREPATDAAVLRGAPRVGDRLALQQAAAQQGRRDAGPFER